MFFGFGRRRMLSAFCFPHVSFRRIMVKKTHTNLFGHCEEVIGFFTKYPMFHYLT